MVKPVDRIIPDFMAQGHNPDFDLPLDSDEDTILYASDNCPSVANADQTNSDGGAFGDVCDPDLVGCGDHGASAHEVWGYGQGVG